MKDRGMAGQGAMRDSMPKVTAWIDALRAAFGKSEVDGWIRQGLQDGSFIARENGHTIGGPTGHG